MAEGSNGASMSIDCAAIDYARRCSSTLLNHLLLEEGASIAWFLFPFFEFYRLMSILAVGRYDKRMCGIYFQVTLLNITGKDACKGEKRMGK